MSETGDALSVCLHRADQVIDGVPAELPLQFLGQHDGDHRLGDDAGSRHRADVTALAESLLFHSSRFASSPPDSMRL